MNSHPSSQCLRDAPNTPHSHAQTQKEIWLNTRTVFNTLDEMGCVYYFEQPQYQYTNFAASRYILSIWWMQATPVPPISPLLMFHDRSNPWCLLALCAYTVAMIPLILPIFPFIHLYPGQCSCWSEACPRDIGDEVRICYGRDSNPPQDSMCTHTNVI